MGHLVVCAAQLEAENGLEILALQQNIGLESITQIRRRRQGRLVDDFIDSRGQDQAQVVGIAIGQDKGVGDHIELGFPAPGTICWRDGGSFSQTEVIQTGSSWSMAVDSSFRRHGLRHGKDTPKAGGAESTRDYL